MVQVNEYCRDRTVPHLDKVATDHIATDHIDSVSNKGCKEDNEKSEQQVHDYSLLINRDFRQLICDFILLSLLLICDFSLLICESSLKHLADLKGPIASNHFDRDGLCTVQTNNPDKPGVPGLLFYMAGTG